MKLVINKCYGGFGLSEAAVRWMRAQGDKEALPNSDGGMCTLPGESFSDGTVNDFAWLTDGFGGRGMTRHNPILVQCVKALGAAASGKLAQLEVIEIPDGIQYEIDEYDGIESVSEVHRSWG